jgi:hypothetical protein
LSLASLKRRIVVGTLLKLTRHDWFPNGSMTVNGNLGTTQLKGRVPLGTVRPVVEVQAGQIGIRTGTSEADYRTSYLQWPKASCLRETENGFDIDLNHNGRFEAVMSYEIVAR